MSPNDCHARSSEGSSSGSSNSIKQRVTTIPGRCINPTKLENMLRSRFGEEYDVEMRNDRYTIKARNKIQYSDIKNCY
ncbi:hypothetical protein ANO14919_057300 [Xylariales sp. No.14919]|nr:hypothetical protein F5X98DRAFT_253032 [Xylaria grammica]GAW16305.1 hypothetical protein ANO14919_057300 [Xylariales sp. No.14919]